MEATKKKRLKLKEGDIFTISIDEQTQGYGQIVKIPNKNSLIIIVFEGRCNKNEDIPLDKIVKNQILFLGFTTDALLFHGRWIIIGNLTTNLSSVIMPYYKLGLPSEPQNLIDYKVEALRIATPEEVKLLDYHHGMSPMGYQKELQAYYGVIEWEADIKYSYKHIVNILTKLNLLCN